MEDNLNPVDDGQQVTVEPLDIEESENMQEVAEPVKQTQEDNSKYAAARRESELKLKEYERILQAEREKTNKFAKSLGYESFEDVEKRLEKELQEKQRYEYQQKYGIDPEMIKPIVDEALKSHPVNKELEELKKQRDAEIKNQNIKKQITEFNNEFGTELADIEDVAKLPNIDKMMVYFERGLDLLEAYKLVNFNDIVHKKGAALKKAEAISKSGRSHMGATIGTSEDINTITVPKDIYDRYKKKGLSEEKIRRIYKQAYHT